VGKLVGAANSSVACVTSLTIQITKALNA
jgi:hypothetical protein